MWPEREHVDSDNEKNRDTFIRSPQKKSSRNARGTVQHVPMTGPASTLSDSDDSQEKSLATPTNLNAVTVNQKSHAPWHYVLVRTGITLYRFLENSDSSFAAQVWSWSMMATIFVSITCFVLQTHQDYQVEYADFWFGIEVFTTVVFLVEYLLRLSVCRIYGTVYGFLSKKLNICDLLAILPFFVEAATNSSDAEALRVFRVVRLVRIVRLIKRCRNSLGVRVLSHSLSDSAKAINILFLWISLSLILFSALMYYAEKYNCPASAFTSVVEFTKYNAYCDGDATLRSEVLNAQCCIFKCDDKAKGMFPRRCQYGLDVTDAIYFWEKPPRVNEGDIYALAVHSGQPAFFSVPRAFWWSMVTMTTVGYGDAVPQSIFGGLVGAVTMLCGILTIALPMAIIGTKFNEHYHKLLDEDPLTRKPKAAVQEIKNSFLETVKKDDSVLNALEMSKQDSQNMATTPASENDVSPTRTKRSLRDTVLPALERLKRDFSAEDWETQLKNLKEMVERSNALKKEILATHSCFNRCMFEITSEASALVEHYLIDKGIKEDPFCDYSLYLFSFDGKFRRWCYRLAQNPGFDTAVFILIIMNTLLFIVQSPWRGPDYWAAIMEDSLEVVFLVCFTMEMAVKVIAYGFFVDKYSYLRDAWNWLDFTVIVTGWFQLIATRIFDDRPGDFMCLRTFRVLRPLRSVSTLPGMRALVHTVMASIQKLSTVVTMLAFLLIVLGVLGINFWGGQTHRRCRLTNSPLVFAPQRDKCEKDNDFCFTPETLDFQFWCQQNPQSGMVNGTWRRIPAVYDSQMCYHRTMIDGEVFVMWPVDLQQTRLCGGSYMCQAPDPRWYEHEQISRHLHLASLEDKLEKTFCGTSIMLEAESGPANGPHRVARVNRRVHRNVDNYHRENEVPLLNQGLSNFDNLLSAAVLIFQSITLEGWVDIMYMLQDSGGSWLSTFVYFFSLILVGAFFLINVTLAIVSTTFSEAQDAAEKEESDFREKNTAAEQPKARQSDEGVVFVRPPLHEKVSTIVRIARVISFSELFQNFIMFVISANVVVMALDCYPPPSQRQQEIVSALNQGFLWTLILECVLLNAALGMSKYWTTPIHIFDGLVVVVSVIVAITGDGSGGSATALRAMRLLRIFKLAKKWTSFRMLLKSMFATVLQMGNFFFLLVVITLVFALTGQSFFHTMFILDGDSRPIERCQTYDKYFGVDAEYCQTVCPMGANGLPSCVPRSHFDTLWWAWMTVFQILSGENWNLVMYDGMTAGGRGFFLYFAAVVIFGSFVILNLCLAILMSIFEENSEHNRQLEANMRKVRQRKVRAMMLGRTVFSRLQTDLETAESRQKAPVKEESGSSDDNDIKKKKEKDATNEKARQATIGEKAVLKLTALFSIFFKLQPLTEVHTNTSCMIFPHGGVVERTARKCVQHKRFDQVILFGIIVSSCLMIFNDPLMDPGGAAKRALTACDTAFTVIFTVEMIVKAIAYNLLWSRPPMQHSLGETEEQKEYVDRSNRDLSVAYLRTGWNILDLTVVLVSWIDLCLEADNDVSVLKAVRTLRALRPMRLVSRNRNLKLVVNTIFQAMPEFLNLLIVSALFYLIFSLFFVTLYLGGFYSCVNNEYESMPFTNHTINNVNVGTPLCIDHGKHNFVTMVASKDECAGTNKTFHQRLSTRTPICVLHCKDRMTTGFCHQDAIWGYNVMTCTHCQEMVAAEFNEPTKMPDEYDACTRECETAWTEDYFCGPFNDKYMKGQLTSAEVPLRDECVRECQAQCLAGNAYCEGLRDESAWCVEQGNRWAHKIPQHFDDVSHGMLALFEIATTEGWIDVMRASVDSTGAYSEPVRDVSEEHALYYFVFIFFGSFFLLNLFVGVTIDNFNRIRHERKQSNAFLTFAQERWVNSQQTFYAVQRFFPLMNLHLLPSRRRRCYFIVASRAFETTIMVAIVLNAISMGCQMHPAPESYRNTLTTINYAFAVIFNFEAGLKMYALRMAYFCERWNCFDFFCVMVTNVGILVLLATRHPAGTLMLATRFLRVARLLRLVRFMKRLNKLFTAFLFSLPKLANVAAILFLLLFIFSILGMNMFATVLQTGAHNEHANFRTFPVSIATLFRCMTGEGWNQLMHDLSKTPFDFKSVMEVNCLHMRVSNHEDWLIHKERGEIDVPVGCGEGIRAQAFFVVFTLLVSFLMLNLFVAVILEGFEEATKSEDADTLETCINEWKKYDPECTMMIHLRKACLFVEDVCGPCGATLQNEESVPFGDFDLQTARTLQFKLSCDGQNSVHFFSAVLAVFRLKIVYVKEDARESAAILKELESFEQIKAGCTNFYSVENDEVREVIESLKSMQRKQQKSLSKEMGTAEVADDDLISFEAQVAAAKIQIRWKTLIRNKRRPEGGEDRAGHHTGSGHDPIARPAG